MIEGECIISKDHHSQALLGGDGKLSVYKTNEVFQGCLNQELPLPPNVVEVWSSGSSGGKSPYSLIIHDSFFIQDRYGLTYRTVGKRKSDKMIDL